MPSGFITVRIELKEGADFDDVVSDMDYDFNHPNILDTEITDSECVSE